MGPVLGLKSWGFLASSCLFSAPVAWYDLGTDPGTLDSGFASLSDSHPGLQTKAANSDRVGSKVLSGYP